MTTVAPADLTPKDVAALCRVTLDTVRRWTRSGRLPAPYKIGRMIRWRQDDIDAWRRKISGQDIALTPSETAWAETEDDEVLLTLASQAAPPTRVARIERAAAESGALTAATLASMLAARRELMDVLKCYADYIGEDGVASSARNDADGRRTFVAWSSHVNRILGVHRDDQDQHSMIRRAMAYAAVAEIIEHGMAENKNRAEINAAAFGAIHRARGV